MLGPKARDRQFFDAFAKHAALCVEGARKLAELLEDLDSAEALAKEVKRIEHDADTITHQTVRHLHETWITPLDRSDIHDLITHLDDVLDMIEAVSERVAIFHVRAKNPLAVDLARVLLQACEKLASAVTLLPEVSKAAKSILDASVEINRL